MNEQTEGQIVQNQQVGEDNIDLVAWLNRILAHWYWFVIAVGLALFGGWLHLRYSTPVYKTVVRLLVPDEKRGGGMIGGGALGDFWGMMGMPRSLDNEVEILKTFNLMQEVVTALDGHIIYKTRGRIKENETLDPRYKVQVDTPADSIHTRTELIVEPHENANRIRVQDKNRNLDMTVSLDELIFIPNLGNVRFTLNTSGPWAEAGPEEKGPAQRVIIVPPSWTTGSYLSRLGVTVTNKQTSIIDLSFTYPIPEKSELILNTLINKYVVRTLKEKNIVADSTLIFLDDRLQFVGWELGIAEDRIQQFKQERQLTDISAQSQLLIEKASQHSRELAAVESQLLMIDEVERYLVDTTNLRIVPASISGNDATFASLAQAYNKLLFDRERLLLSHTEDNIYVKNLDQQLRSLRDDMHNNLNSARQQLNVTRNQLLSRSKQLAADIHDIPLTERDFIDLSRQQQIKQELYLFLQQRREEAAIGKTANISNARVIDGPRTRGGPISPNRNSIYLACLVLGLAVPLGIVFLRELLNVRVQTKEDITRRAPLPILGEIGRNPDEYNQISITRESRTPIAEQFRALRTNLDFFSGTKKTHTILLTSSMSGEGKSYVALNLAIALALSNKKVVLLELDLRKPTISRKLDLDNNFGFTNYIIKDQLTVRDVLRPSGQHEGLEVISSGPIPPNPAEIIQHERTDNLFKELRSSFDYIVVDAPPVGMVTDAQLLSRFADTTLYVVRLGVTFKKQIEIPADLTQYKKMPSLNFVVNDIVVGKGYGYGGYGYGYGYYAQSTKRKWWQFGKTGMS